MKTDSKITANIIFQRILFSVLIFLAVFLQVLFFANIVMWRASPNRGWRTIAELGPTIVGVTSPLGEKAGLRVGDKILNLNGKAYETYDEFIKVIDLQIGHANVYTIERDGQMLTISVTNQKLGIKRVIIQSGLFWILGMIFFGIGIVVFLMKPYHEESWAFLTMTLIMGIFITYSAPSFYYKPPWLENTLV
ncbi:MAG: hypothetical protein MIO92_04410, partial [Methanosarcinaceae archaeon]|nr:hypothetical protein [Methanosarcinaceae archaeon]